MTLLLIFLLILIIFIGTPVAFGTGFLAVLSILLFLSPEHLHQITSIAYNQGSSMINLIIPLFILMAETLTIGEIASDIFSVLSRWLKRIKGGLAISTVLACTVFAALCGSSPATAISIGRISIKEMTRRGYNARLAIGTVAAGGSIGIMIPPSITLAVYGIITETSIAQLLIAGILPGLFISFTLCAYIILRVNLDAQIAGDQSSESLKDLYDLTPRIRRQWVSDFKKILPPVILIGLVLLSIYTGWMTPTEAAGLGAVGSIVMVILMGRVKLGLFRNILLNSVKNSTMILFLMFGGLAFGYVMSSLGIAQQTADYIISVGTSKWIFLTAVYILWLILGCLFDPMTMIVVTVPFIFPTFMAFGFDPVWLGVVVTLAVEIGMITPPVGFNLFVLGSLPEVEMGDVMRGSLPFLFVLLFCLVILTFFPQIALYLPSMM